MVFEHTREGYNEARRWLHDAGHWDVLNAHRDDPERLVAEANERWEQTSCVD